MTWLVGKKNLIFSPVYSFFYNSIIRLYIYGIKKKFDLYIYEILLKILECDYKIIISGLFC